MRRLDTTDNATFYVVERSAGARKPDDVARVAGVSVATASKALNDTGRMTDATRLRVKQTAAALGFRHSDFLRLDAMACGALSDTGAFAAQVEAMLQHDFDQAREITPEDSQQTRRLQQLEKRLAAVTSGQQTSSEA